jgi:hypothetical protein
MPTPTSRCQLEKTDNVKRKLKFSLRSTLSLGSRPACSPPNEESAPGCIQRPPPEPRIHPGIRPQAEYQDEFYRTSCHAYSSGSLITFPEFSTARGCVKVHSPFLGELIFTCPLGNGVWNFCVKVIDLSSTLVGFHDRGRR